MGSQRHLMLENDADDGIPSWLVEKAVAIVGKAAYTAAVHPRVIANEAPAVDADVSDEMMELENFMAGTPLAAAGPGTPLQLQATATPLSTAGTTAPGTPLQAPTILDEERFPETAIV